MGSDNSITGAFNFGCQLNIAPPEDIKLKVLTCFRRYLIAGGIVFYNYYALMSTVRIFFNQSKGEYNTDFFVLKVPTAWFKDYIPIFILCDMQAPSRGDYTAIISDNYVKFS